MKESINNVKRIKYAGYGNLFCIDESLNEINETGTFKDKQPQTLDKLFKSKPLKKPLTLGAMSTGNTAYSILKFALDYNKTNKYKITPVIYLPHGIENRPYFGPDTNGNCVSGREYISILDNIAHKAEGMLIYLDFGTPGKKSSKDYLSSLRLAKVAKQYGAIKEGETFLNITEGLETTTFIEYAQIDSLSEKEYLNIPKLRIRAYEPIIVNGLKHLKKRFGKKPKYIICQFGAGILFNEIKTYCDKNKIGAQIIPVAVGDPQSCAEKIYPSYWADKPTNLRNGGTTISRHNGAKIYGVEDWEIGITLTQLRDILNAEASGVAGLAILHRLEEIIPELNKEKDVVLTINTGNGIPNFREIK
jgi:hypothetical protein